MVSKSRGSHRGFCCARATLEGYAKQKKQKRRWRKHNQTIRMYPKEQKGRLFSYVTRVRDNRKTKIKHVREPT